MVPLEKLQRSTAEVGKSVSSTISDALHKGSLYEWQGESNHKYTNTSMHPTLRHGGGNVMLWSCFSLAVTGKRVRVDGEMENTK